MIPRGGRRRLLCVPVWIAAFGIARWSCCCALLLLRTHTLHGFIRAGAGAPPATAAAVPLRWRGGAAAMLVCCCWLLGSHSLTTLLQQPPAPAPPSRSEQDRTPLERRGMMSCPPRLAGAAAPAAAAARPRGSLRFVVAPSTVCDDDARLAKGPHIAATVGRQSRTTDRRESVRRGLHAPFRFESTFLLVILLRKVRASCA